MKKISSIFLSAMAFALIWPATLVSAESLVPHRLYGNTRVETSISVSKEAYPEEVDQLLLAGYRGDADALAATFMAGQLNAPLLISDSRELSKELKTEIKRLNPKEIILLGGSQVISPAIEAQLKENYPTRRMSGNSRVETAVKIVADYYEDKVLDEVFLVEYNSLVDALAVGPVAAKTGIPVLITEKNALSREVKNFLEEKDIKKVTIIGGENTITTQGKKEIEKIVENVERVYGQDRIDTSLEIAEKYFNASTNVFIANGWKNADALVGGYLGGKLNAPILLTAKDDLTIEIEEYLQKNQSNVFVLGGESVISNRLVLLVQKALGQDVVVPPSEKEKKKEKKKQAFEKFLLSRKFPVMSTNASKERELAPMIKAPSNLPKGLKLTSRSATADYRWPQGNISKGFEEHVYSFPMKFKDGGSIRKCWITWKSGSAVADFGFSGTDELGKNLLASVNLETERIYFTGLIGASGPALSGSQVAEMFDYARQLEEAYWSDY